MNLRSLSFVATLSILILAGCEQESDPEPPATAESPTPDEATDEAATPPLELSTIDGEPTLRCYLSGSLEMPAGLDCEPDGADPSDRLFLVSDALKRDSTVNLLQTHDDGLLLDGDPLENPRNLAPALRDRAEQQATEDANMAGDPTPRELIAILDGDRTFGHLTQILMNAVQAGFAIEIVPRLDADLTSVDVSTDDGDTSLTAWSPAATYPVAIFSVDDIDQPTLRIALTDEGIQLYDSRRPGDGLAVLESLDALSEEAATFLEEEPDGGVLLGAPAETSISRTAEILGALRSHDGRELFTAFGFFTM